MPQRSRTRPRRRLAVLWVLELERELAVAPRMGPIGPMGLICLWGVSLVPFAERVHATFLDLSSSTSQHQSNRGRGRRRVRGRFRRRRRASWLLLYSAAKVTP